jgi:alpha-D-xyloside xylohydrolase
MALEFPEDRGAAAIDTQYMLGESLLVAPVFNAEGDVDFYLPEGTWTDLLTGQELAGPRWVHQRHGFDSLPLLVRPDTVLPVGARTDRPDYDYADGVVLHLYELKDGHRSVTRVPALGGRDGASFTVTRVGRRIVVEAEGTQRPWSVHVAGGPQAQVAPDALRLEIEL